LTYLIKALYGQNDLLPACENAFFLMIATTASGNPELLLRPGK
jgi:hypothetical protein